jgi:hypothetical protein
MSVLDQRAQEFMNEAMKYAGDRFPIEYLTSCFRQLAQKDLELQQRERELYAFQQNLTQLHGYQSGAGRAPYDG